MKLFQFSEKMMSTVRRGVSLHAVQPENRIALVRQVCKLSTLEHPQHLAHTGH